MVNLCMIITSVDLFVVILEPHDHHMKDETALCRSSFILFLVTILIHKSSGCLLSIVVVQVKSINSS
jgi:hypothetical protein